MVRNTRRPRPMTKDKRDLILTIAARVFREKGYDATSVQEIADAAGLQKGGLYYHISSKEHLLYEIIEAGMIPLLERLEEICASELAATRKLTLAIENQVANTAEMLDNLYLVARERHALSAEHEGVYLAKRDRYEALVRGILSEGIQEGEFRNVDVKMATFAILSMLNGIVEWYSPTGPLTSRVIVDIYTDFVLRGLTGRGQ